MDNGEHRRIWTEWHRASVSRDQEALLALYAEDAILEAPLIPTVLDQDSGIVRGRAEIRAFLDASRRRSSGAETPDVTMRWWREDRFFSAGDTLVWEYPRQTPDGEQIDIVEVMRIEGGLIRHHRVYWGWKLTSTLFRG